MYSNAMILQPQHYFSYKLEQHYKKQMSNKRKEIGRLDEYEEENQTEENTYDNCDCWQKWEW